MPYPDLDSLTNPAASDPRVGHALLHSDINEALRYGVRKATVTLSSADILALDSTPVTIIAAPGAGKWLVPHQVTLAVDFATTPYVNGDNWPGLYYAGPGPQIKALDILSQASSARSMESPTVGADATNTDDVAIVAGYGSPSTDGDSALTVIVWYSIEDSPA